MTRSPWHLASLVFFCCLGLATHLGAQSAGDPRATQDPRTVSDPRTSTDPRDAELKPSVEARLNPPRGSDLFDQLYDNGNLAALSDVLIKYQWDLSDYIYDQCNSWVSMTNNESASPRSADAASEKLETKVREIARLSDLGIGDTRFRYYIEKIFNMDAGQRIQREEQIEFLARGANVIETASSAQETLQALTSLRQSLSRALKLGDLRGQSRANSLIARAQILNQRPTGARANAREAIRVGQSVRDMNSIWNGWATIIEASLALNDFAGTKQGLQEQHQLALQVGDERTADLILQQLLRLEQALGTYLPDTLIIYGPRIDQPIRRF